MDLPKTFGRLENWGSAPLIQRNDAGSKQQLGNPLVNLVCCRPVTIVTLNSEVRRMFLLLSPANYEEPLLFIQILSELVWCWEKCMRDWILWMIAKASPSSQLHWVAGPDGSLQRVEAATIYRCSETGGHVLALNEG